MRIISRLSFQGKIILGITAILLAFGLATAFMASRTARASLLAESKQLGGNMARALSARAVESLLTMDMLRLKIAVDQTRALNDAVAYAFIQDLGGQILVHTFQGGFPTALGAINRPGPETDPDRVSVLLLDTGPELVYDFAAPVAIGRSIIGTARIGLSRSGVERTSNRLLATIFAITGAGGLAAVVLGSVFARRVTRRINLLRASAEEIVHGNLDLQTGPILDRNCWEIQECRLTECPAHGDVRRRCWYLAGTLCRDHAEQDGITEPGADQRESCRRCRVYRAGAGDELQDLAEAFDVMALTLKSNIGELRSKEADLSRQRQFLRTIFDVTPDLMSLQDTDLRYKAVNKAFCTFFHRDERELIGRNDSDIFSPEQAAANLAEDRRILATGQPLSKQILITRERARRWLHVVKVPVTDAGRTLGLLLTARDVTVLKQYQEQLIQSQKMEDLGKLAGGVAHEINTPLGIILGYAQLLKEDFPEDSQAHLDLAVVERQAKVCRKIVADLLGFSRQVASERVEMDLNGSIEEVVSLVDLIFRQERVFMETHLAPDIPPIVADRDKLKQVWMNLLNNAFDAVGHDGRIFVRTRLCMSRQRVIVSVADTGTGIGQEDLGRIFDPFFSTKPAGSGTGLGLSVSFGIIQDHGGKISATSPAPVEYLESGEDKSLTRKPGPGTVFFVELPLAGQALPDDECIEIARARELAES